MATIAVVGLPAHGHTNPTLPVIKRLVARGHIVRVYNGESFRQKLAPTGAEFRPLPEPMPSAEEFAQAIHHILDASRLIASLSARLTRFMLAEFGSHPPDLVLYDSIAMWGYVAARKRQIPNICLITTFVLDGAARQIGCRTLAGTLLRGLPHIPALLRWRRQMAQEFGAENAAGITAYAPLNLVFTSREFHPPNDFLDDRFRCVGPALDPALRDGSLAGIEFTPGAQVYVSLGTVQHADPEFYRRLFAALADFPANFIVSLGRTTSTETLGEPPPNFRLYPYVPQLAVLQRVDAFITHGGLNSVHEGLVYGVPLLVVPQQFEQTLNGRRIAALGAGLLLEKPTPARLRQGLERLLGEPGFRERATAVGERLLAAGGADRAVAEIEGVLGDR